MVWHDAMKLMDAAIEDQGKEVSVSLPKRQVENSLDGDPLERAFGIVGMR
jgi:hypothetical protein